MGDASTRYAIVVPVDAVDAKTVADVSMDRVLTVEPPSTLSSDAKFWRENSPSSLGPLGHVALSCPVWPPSTDARPLIKQQTIPIKIVQASLKPGRRVGGRKLGKTPSSGCQKMFKTPRRRSGPRCHPVRSPH